MTPHKAVVAAILAGVGALCTALTVGTPDTVGDWVVILATAVAAGLGTYQVANKPKTDPGEAGVVNWIAVGAIALVVFVLIVLFTQVIDVGKDKDNNGKRGNDWERHPVVSLP